MPMAPDTLQALIMQAFPDAQVSLVDTAGDGDHYALTVVSSAFVGQTRVKQHKMVYQALQGAMADTLHALSITTSAPEGVPTSSDDHA